MEKSLTVAGVGLTVEPVRLGALPAFVRAVQPFAQALSAGVVDPVQLLADHGERVAQALQVATGQPRSWIDALALDDAVELAVAVVEVNAGFLRSRLLPAIEAAGGRLHSVLPIPSMPSTPSSATGS